MGGEFIHGANAGASSPAMAGHFALDAVEQYLNQLAFYLGSPRIDETSTRRLLGIRALWVLCRSLEPNKAVLEGCELFSVHEPYWLFQDIVFHRDGWLLPEHSASQWRQQQSSFVVTRKPAGLVLLSRRGRIGTPSPVETVVEHANDILSRIGTCTIDGAPELPGSPPPMI